VRPVLPLASAEERGQGVRPVLPLASAEERGQGVRPVLPLASAEERGPGGEAQLQEGKHHMPTGITLPGQPDTLGALAAMRNIILAECLVSGVSPFAALSAADAARYGVANAVFIGRPKDFNDAYLPQCVIWIPPEQSSAQVEAGTALESVSGRASAEFEALIQVFVDMRADWYAGEQKVLAIRDALWPALLRHARLGGTVPTVIASEALPGRGLDYEQIAGVEYRLFEARWRVRQQWSIAGGLVV
jgi:hypothetical protein